MKSRANFEEAEDTGYDRRLGYTSETVQATLYKVNITTEFVGPDYYTAIFDLLLDAGPQDTVRFLVSSPGGRVDGLIILLEGIRLTQARTEVILAGNAYSAAGILCMAVDEVQVLPNADMLCHCMRYGVGGKAPDVLSHVEHSQKTSAKMFAEYFEGFLTPAEISRVVDDGKELYLEADQIIARFAAREEYFEKQLKEQGIDIEADKSTEAEADTDLQPRKRGRKSKKEQ